MKPEFMCGVVYYCHSEAISGSSIEQNTYFDQTHMLIHMQSVLMYLLYKHECNFDV